MNRKWSTEKEDNRNLRVYLCVSRTKDNKDIPDFKQRRNSFIAYENKESIGKRFKEFVKDGVLREKSRLYCSVNLRNEEKLRRMLVAELLLNDNIKPITHLNSILAGLAAKKECALEKKWLFDFDSKDEELLNSFVNDMKLSPNGEDLEIEVTKTVNGFAVVCNHGFDTRKLLEKYKDYVELKKDDMLFMKIEENK